MAKARIDIEVVQAGVAERRLAQIARAEQRLNVQFKGGMITSEQLRKSTERLSRAKALLTRRLNTNSASLRRGNRAAATMTTTLGSLRSIALGVGVTFGAWQVARILGGALRTAAEFEAGMNRVKALTQATRKEFSLLEEKAKTLGSTTVFSARQVTDAMGFLAQAGFSVNEIVGSMRDTLNLAAAAGLDLGTAADIVSNVMSGFGIRVEELGSAVDVLAKASISANTDLLQLGQAMKLAGPVAKQFGLTFEETTAAIALMGNAGFQSTLAGTALRGALIRLAASAKKFGIDVFDARGKLLPLVEIMRRLRTAGLSDTEMFELLGQRAGPAFAALLSQGEKALERMTVELKESGDTAENIAKTKMEGLKGATVELSSAWEGFIIGLAKTEEIEAATRALAGLLQAFTLMGKEVREGGLFTIGDQDIDFFQKLNQDLVKGKITLVQLRAAIKVKGSLITLSEKDLALLQSVSAVSKERVEDAKAALLAEKELAEAKAAIAAATPLGLAKAEAAAIVAKAKAAAAAIELAAKESEAAKKAADLLDKLAQKLPVINFISQGDLQLLKLIEDLDRAKEAKREFRNLTAIPQLSEGDLQLVKLIDDLKVAKEQEAELGRQAKEMQQAHEDAFRRMKAGIDSFLTQTFFAARSLKDVWNSVVQQMLRVFISMVAKMVAGWLLGMRQMQAASAGGGGGGLRGILGTIFGGGGGLGGIFGGATAPGGTGTFSGAPIGSRLISGGGGVGVARFSGAQASMPTAPPGSATGIAGQETLLAKLGINLRGIGPISGGVVASAGILAALFGIQRGSPLIGALGGAAAGFAFGGPIGAIIGAIIGGVAAMFSRGKIRRRAAAAQEAMVQQMQSVVEEFKRFQIDSEAALSTIDQLNAGFAQQVQPLGKYGRRATTFVAGFAQSVKSRIREIQSAREARLLLSASSLIPEFSHGGLVPSLLHPGEFVVQRQAVQQVGVQNLERINRGEAPAGNVNLTVNVFPPQGMSPEQAADFTIRKIQRAARNRGIAPPV